MKHLIYFLLFSTLVFSQNYSYSLEESQKKTLPVLPIVQNQLEEIEYFKAYLLPLSEKYNLQKALDTHGAVRLGKGDYSAVNVVIRSDQKLYGHPTLSQVGNITIAAGSKGVVLNDLYMIGKELRFQAGAPITNCILKTIKWADIRATNALVEGNLFINIMSTINFDCSTSGYIRNNKIIKHQVHATSNQLVMKGNSTSPSYGNVHLWANFLTPGGDTTDISELQSATFIGLDSEGWNLKSLGTKPMLQMQNVGDVKITDFGGGDYDTGKSTAPFSIDGNNLLFLNKYIKGQTTAPASIVGAKTNVLFYNGNHDDYVRGTGTVTGFDVKARYGEANNQDVILNGIPTTTLISDPTAIAASVLGNQYEPWARPIWETLPDPLGINWITNRVGKTDSTSYIQDLINTKGIAELPEGVYYISSTLSMIVDGTKGIVGAGTGKTVICGLTDDFPLLSLVESANGDNNFVLSNLTLQGGSIGVYAPDDIDMIAFTNLKYLVFRNQKYGIHLYRNFGFDNSFFDNVSFVKCNIGFFQDPHPVFTVENSGYVDKVVFYNGQYLNCEMAASMRATRADNLNAWVNCKFDHNKTTLNLSGQNFAIAANCDFTNTAGSSPSGSIYTYSYKENAVINGDLSYYSCNFYNNKTPYIFNSKGTIMEGCNLSDDITVFANREHYSQTHSIINSTVNGSIGGGSGYTSGLFVNSNFLKHLEFSKLLVNLKSNVRLTIIDKKSNPYPQLLVTQ